MLSRRSFIAGIFAALFVASFAISSASAANFIAAALNNEDQESLGQETSFSSTKRAENREAPQPIALDTSSPVTGLGVFAYTGRAPELVQLLSPDPAPVFSQSRSPPCA